MNPEQLFLAKLPVIEQIIDATCRRHCLFGADAEDFASGVKLKLIDDDYAVLRKFGGKSQLETYLTAVIANLLRDYRIQLWGKWRPSAAAKRLGPPALQLEQLLYRDGYRLDEAIEILRTNYRVELSAAQLHDLAARLPPRVTRAMEGEERLQEVAGEERAERGAIERERIAVQQRAEEALAKTLEGLPAEDRVLLKMRFWDDFTVARIANILGRKQRPLYTRIDKLLKQLRARLEEEGLAAHEVAELLDLG